MLQIALTLAAEIKALENVERGRFGDIGIGPPTPRGNGTSAEVVRFSTRHRKREYLGTYLGLIWDSISTGDMSLFERLRLCGARKTAQYFCVPVLGLLTFEVLNFLKQATDRVGRPSSIVQTGGPQIIVLGISAMVDHEI